MLKNILNLQVKIKIIKMKYIILYSLLFWVSGICFAQKRIPIQYDEKSTIVYQKENTFLHFEAKTPYLQISTEGLNNLDLRSGSETGTVVSYYEKNKTSKNADFLFDNLTPGQPYYITFQYNYFEKDQAEISLIAMQERLNMNRIAKNVKPFQNVKAVENINTKSIKN